jgi:hypothetical protein
MKEGQKMNAAKDAGQGVLQKLLEILKTASGETIYICHELNLILHGCSPQGSNRGERRTQSQMHTKSAPPYRSSSFEGLTQWDESEPISDRQDKTLPQIAEMGKTRIHQQLLSVPSRVPAAFDIPGN